MLNQTETPTLTVTIYLLKQRYSEPDAVLKRDLPNGGVRISPVGNVPGMLYVQPGFPKPPRWAQFFSGAVEPRQFGRVSSAAAVLVTPAAGRLFAVTFGHGRYLLAPDSWEERFGLRVALNSIDENKLRSIDKQTFDAIARHSREQASRDASPREFGIDVEQDLLRAVTGVPRDPALGRRMSGMDALNVAVPVTLTQLPALLERYLQRYNDTAYRKTFPWVDQIGAIVDRSLRVALDDALVEKLKAGEVDKIWMAVPEILEWERVGGFRFGLRKRHPEYHDLPLRGLLEALSDIAELSRDVLLAQEVHCRDSDGLPLARWSAYRCLYCELEYGDEEFLLAAGKWYRIAREFVREVNEAYARIPLYSRSLPEYEDSSETAYNRRVAETDGQYFVLMDRKDIPHGGGQSSIEFCDLFTRDKDLIHVKRYGNSSVLSHLFSQGLISGELFQTDGEFRRKVNELLPISHRIPNPLVKPGNGQFQVVFAVICDMDGELKLPFFSRLNIKHAARRLEGYGYNVARLKIPVADHIRRRRRYR